tara:strand:+ start:452 stop:667 length:216 start_codon:yes stop_codon:yes gene_type:complete
MKIRKTLIFSFVAPLMVLISVLGLFLSNDKKKIFYMPIGLVGIFIIFEKEVSRKLKRQSILKKIKSFQKIQ